MHPLIPIKLDINTMTMYVCDVSLIFLKAHHVLEKISSPPVDREVLYCSFSTILKVLSYITRGLREQTYCS